MHYGLPLLETKQKVTSAPTDTQTCNSARQSQYILAAEAKPSVVSWWNVIIFRSSQSLGMAWEVSVLKVPDQLTELSNMQRTQLSTVLILYIIGCRIRLVS